jgi:hypothetical protein
MKDEKDGWSRAQATVKLVGRRKKMLEQVARDHAPGCSPVQAMDRALELATAKQEPSAPEFESLEDLIAAIDDRRRAEATRVNMAITKLAGQIERLHALISELADEQG